jgi:hypothetical protein
MTNSRKVAATALAANRARLPVAMASAAAMKAAPIR